MDTIIREAELEDLNNGLVDIFIEGYRYHQQGRPDIFVNVSDETLRKELMNDFENLPILVIIYDDVIVGYLSYKIKEKHSKKLDVDQLVIKESHRGKGFGRKLMEEAKRIALKNNCDRIELNCWLFNENALAMYEHIGFNKQRTIYEMAL